MRWWNRKPARRDIAERYLHFLRMALLNVPPPHIVMSWNGEHLEKLDKVLMGATRCEGAISMIGIPRMQAVEAAIRDLEARKVPGDIVECGSWRGGACIYMRAVLDVLGCRTRRIFACDAYDKGFPEPDAQYPSDSISKLHTREYFKTPVTLVQDYCKAYGYPDDQLTLVPGWFKESLPTLPTRTVALLRLDGDLYGSIMDSLMILYDKVPVGGYIIVDDYGTILNTKEAVDDFRATRKITTPLIKTDFASSYWIKEAGQ